MKILNKFQMKNIFITSDLLEPLSNEEIEYYFREGRYCREQARDNFIQHNIRLVLNEVRSKFSQNSDLEELVSVGLVGLIKSVDTFNIDLNFKFSTYAAKCIDNEILMFLKKRKKFILDESLDVPVGMEDKFGNVQILMDVLVDKKTDIASEYEKKVVCDEIRKIVYQLPERDREIILLYFGFIDDHTYMQKEIAEKFNVSQSYVSRVIIRNVKKIGLQLKKFGLIETTEMMNKKIGNIEASQLSSDVSVMNVQQEMESGYQNNGVQDNCMIEERTGVKRKSKKLY